MTSTSPMADFGPRVDLADLGELGNPMGSPGQCLSVRPLRSNTNLLLKQYHPGRSTEADEKRIARLVAWPDTLPGTKTGQFVRTSSAWPLSQVTSAGSMIGVLMALAPDRFYERVKDPYGSQRIVLTLDHVAAPNEDLKTLGLKPLDLHQRLRICAGVLAFAEFLERHGLVYGDWSYQNILWSRRDLSIHFIDMDACSFGPQPWVESFGFDDPSTPPGVQVDTYTERYRCSIMAASCLTGIKDPTAALKALATMAKQEPTLREFERVVRANVNAPRRIDREPIRELFKALPAEYADMFVESAPAAAADSANPPDQPPAGDNITNWTSIDDADTPATTATTVKLMPTLTKDTTKPTVVKRPTRAEVQAARNRAVATLTFLTALVLLIIIIATH